MKEVWKDIAEYEGLYQVSNMGRIRTLERVVQFGSQQRIIKPNIRKQKVKNGGYMFIQLAKNGKQKCFHVHRLVAYAFCDGYAAKLQVNHIDGNRRNNVCTNLEWCSRSENQKHAYRVLKRECYMNGKYGSLSHRSKPIIQLSLNGEFIRNWDCAATVERELGISESNIRKCLYGKSKQSHGFRWVYNQVLQGTKC